MKNKDLLVDFYKDKKFEDEEFKFLNYPGVNKYQYVVSSYGRVFKFLNCKEKNIFVHRLIAYTFCKKPKNCNIVNHIDGKKNNNYYKNLEWTTPKGNTEHAIQHGLQINSGINCPSAVYDEKTVRKICEFLEDGYGAGEIYKKMKNENKITDRAFYALIFTIKNKKRHVEISNEYNIPENVKSKEKPKFSEYEIEKIRKMMKEGKTTTEIIKAFGGTTTKTYPGKRIYDKMQQIKRQSK